MSIPRMSAELANVATVSHTPQTHSGRPGEAMRILIAGLCAAFLSTASAHATTTKQDASRLLAAALDADELTRATIAHELGDTRVLDALAQREDVAARLAAVRCSPYLNDPDRALRGLSEIARGRDPE